MSFSGMVERRGMRRRLQSFQLARRSRWTGACDPQRCAAASSRVDLYGSPSELRPPSFLRPVIDLYAHTNCVRFYLERPFGPLLGCQLFLSQRLKVYRRDHP